MKTFTEVREAYKGGRSMRCLYGDDVSRLAQFFPAEDWHLLGLGLREGLEPPQAREWTREEVQAQLASDVRQALEVSTAAQDSDDLFGPWAMFQILRMWMWVLEDDEVNDGDKDQEHVHWSDDKGRAFALAVAEKYEVEL